MSLFNDLIRFKNSKEWIDFEKYYGVRIEIRNQEIRNVVLSGKFRIAEGLDYALSVLQAEIPFHYYRNKATSTLYIE